MVSVVNSMQESKSNADTFNANQYIFKLNIENILFCSCVGAVTMCFGLDSNDFGHCFLANLEKTASGLEGICLSISNEYTRKERSLLKK